MEAPSAHVSVKAAVSVLAEEKEHKVRLLQVREVFLVFLFKYRLLKQEKRASKLTGQLDFSIL